MTGLGGSVQEEKLLKQLKLVVSRIPTSFGSWVNRWTRNRVVGEGDKEKEKKIGSRKKKGKR